MGHIDKLCRTLKNQLVNQSPDRKGKMEVNFVEETRAEMNKFWKNKSEDKSSEDSNSSLGVENYSSIN